MTNTVETPLFHASCGHYVLPVDPVKRIPLIPWKEGATVDENRIKEYWAKYPNAMTGIYCKKSGLFVLDLDHKNGQDGLAELKKLQACYGNGEPFKFGPAQKTPNGGLHIIFKHPNFDMPNNAGILAPGVDLRSEGLIYTGDGYEWLDEHGPGAELTELPKWLLELILKQKKNEPKTPESSISHANVHAQHYLDKYSDQARIGSRNDTGLNLALQLRDLGLSQNEAASYMQAYAGRVPQAAGDPYTADQAMETLKSAYSRPPREPAIPRVDADQYQDEAGQAATNSMEVPEPPDLPLEEYEPEEETHPRFVVRDAAYALQPQPPIDYLVEKLITRGSVSLFYGEPGSKKTYSLISLGVCAASGKPWLNFTTQPITVLLIDEESGERRLSRRIGEAIRGELADGSIPLNYICLAGFKLDNDHDPILLQALIEQTKAELVIIDALADVMDGDENSKQDTQPVFNSLRRIAEKTNAAIIVIHHSNKTGGYRGSSAIKGAVDTMVQVSSEDGSKLVNFKTEKARDGERVSWAAEAVWSEDQFYLKPSEKEFSQAKSKSESFVIRYLQEHTQATISDIEDHADSCSPEAARRAVYSLVQKGLTARVDTGGRGEKAVYSLTAKGISCEL